MSKLFLNGVSALIVCLSVVAFAQSNPSPSGDPFIGRYEGTYKATGRERAETVVEVIAHGRGLYRIQVKHQPTLYIEVYGVAKGSVLRISGYSGSVLWNGSVENGRFKLERADGGYGGTFSAKKVIQHSPTEGLQPTKNATVLLGMTSGKADLNQWTNSKWEALGEGVMRVKGGSGDNRTRVKHGDMEIHLEFKTAHMPNDSGQGRSNSGVYFQDRYEVQVLDSFGLIPGSGDCGSIYQQSVTAENMSYPPGQWQTYDIVFTAPKIDKDGNVKKFPTVTVKHNGVLIQDALEFKTVTGGSVSDKHTEMAPLRLQDHSNPVEFRNIWWVQK